MKYSVACCFLTHNHPDALNEVLEKCQKTYARHGIDICVFDDSDDDATLKIINERISNGASNLFYVDAHKALNGDHKYLLILQGYNLPKDYDYIWPCKDRVCFNESFIEKLCVAIDEGHDVVMAAYEYSRWDVGENLTVNNYTDPTEFYRLYASTSTNWERLVLKRNTMLKSVDWIRYEEIYKIGEHNSFNQTLSLYIRLSEIGNHSIRICRFDEDERFISSKAASTWGNVIFEVWIEKWVSANFSLPSIYDKYKLEAIKSQTNLAELFGSVERMISFQQKGLYTRSVFEKYKNVWGFITNIPLNHLEMIADGNYENVLKETIIDFENSFNDLDFRKAWWLISANNVFSRYYDDRTYRILVGCFNRYRHDMMESGASNIFNGISSIQDLLCRYSRVQ